VQPACHLVLLLLMVYQQLEHAAQHPCAFLQPLLMLVAGVAQMLPLLQSVMVWLVMFLLLLLVLLGGLLLLLRGLLVLQPVLC
jgi:hypothetical protein